MEIDVFFPGQHHFYREKFRYRLPARDERQLTNWTQPKRFCDSCPVRLECTAFAIGNDELHGMWGGLTPRQREITRIQLERTYNVTIIQGTQPNPSIAC